MPPAAPLRVPVEVRRAGGGPRCFRLAHEVSEEGLVLGGAIASELVDAGGPLEVRFPLPDDPTPLSCVARALVLATGDGEDEHGAPRGLRFVHLEEASRARIARYVQERLGIE